MNLLHTLWLLLLLPCAQAHAQSVCPFFTAATAAAHLQAPVRSSTSLTASNEGYCTFTAHDAFSTTTLKLIATTSAQPACPAGKPLTGIGTQASLCTTSTRNQTTDTISARVRSLYLTIQLTVDGKPTTPLTLDQRQSLVQQVAQEVAGNLF